jgi:hypothetical protein
MKSFTTLSVSAFTALALIGCGGPEGELPVDELGMAEQETITCDGPQGDAYGNGPNGAGVRQTIRDWFGYGDRGDTAMRIAKCESGYWSNCCAYGGGTKAHYNYASQYKGLWQMGDNERAQYGFNWCAGAQTKAAFHMWQDRGFQPWSCY